MGMALADAASSRRGERRCQCRRAPPPPLHLPTAPALPPLCQHLHIITISVLSQVYAQLDRFRASPDFNSYLAFIFASGEGLPVEVRTPVFTGEGAALKRMHGHAGV